MGGSSSKDATAAPTSSGSTTTPTSKEGLTGYKDIDAQQPNLDMFQQMVIPKDQLKYTAIPPAGSRSGNTPNPGTSGMAPGMSTGPSASISAPLGSPENPISSSEVQGGLHLDEHGNPDVFRQGRYRVANPSTFEYLKATQPASAQVAKQMENQMQNMRKHLEETEGLKIGTRRMAELSQQWRFFLASEPVQRGMDAGFLTGSFVAAMAVAFKPSNRRALRVAWLWICGFGIGMVGFPMSLAIYEERRTEQIMSKDQDMFIKQRQEYYESQKRK